MMVVQETWEHKQSTGNKLNIERISSQAQDQAQLTEPNRKKKMNIDLPCDSPHVTTITIIEENDGQDKS